MKKCNECNKIINRRVYPGGLCEGCYRYKLNGGTQNPLPPKGEIHRDHRGNVICHICGRAYKRLGSHVRESHNMTIATYKEMFGLCSSSRTTEATYSALMKQYAYENNMPDQLIASGINTRIKKGENHMRKNKQIRLQEKKNKMAKALSGGNNK